MSDVEPSDPPGLMLLIDEYMRRILERGEDPVEVLAELMGVLTESPLFERMWCAGALYRSFGVLSDIVDAYPVDYGADAEEIAGREIRDAALGWLSTPRTREGVEQYLDRLDMRLEVAPAIHGGRLVRGAPVPEGSPLVAE